MHKRISSFIKSVLNGFITAARATGRTSAMINSLKDGDVVVVSFEGEAGNIRRKCEERGVFVNVICAKTIDELEFKIRGLRNIDIYFEHTFVERAFLDAITMCEFRIDNMLKMTRKNGWYNAQPPHVII